MYYLIGGEVITGSQPPPQEISLGRSLKVSNRFSIHKAKLNNHSKAYISDSNIEESKKKEDLIFRYIISSPCQGSRMFYIEM
jgi:hypothetical protein